MLWYDISISIITENIRTWNIGMNSIYLTEEQKQHWHDEGYLILRQVLSSKEVEEILTAVDKVIESYVQQTPKLQGTRFGSGAFTIIRAIERTPTLDSLTDHPNTFGTILSLMGSVSTNYGYTNICSSS